jgi:hypothetical protein
MPRKSAAFEAFDNLMGELLTVPKAELDARVRAHKEKAALNPNKRGPKPKLKSSSDVPVSAEDTGS